MDQVIQLIGAILVLVAFAGVQMRRLRADSLVYLILNLVGSVILCVLAVVAGQWGFVLLEVAWGLVSAVGLIAVMRGGTVPGAGVAEP